MSGKVEQANGLLKRHLSKLAQETPPLAKMTTSSLNLT
jgi:hypothetical protein